MTNQLATKEQENNENDNMITEKQANCVSMHVQALLHKKDMGYACEVCSHGNKCKYDWLSIMEPILLKSTAPFRLARMEPSTRWEVEYSDSNMEEVEGEKVITEK